MRSRRVKPSEGYIVEKVLALVILAIVVAGMCLLSGIDMVAVVKAVTRG